MQVSYNAQAGPIPVTLQGGITATMGYNAARQRASYAVVAGPTPLYSAQLPGQ
jgi:hypothetical protein